MGWNPFKRKSDGFTEAFVAAARRAGLEVLGHGPDGAELRVSGEPCKVSFANIRRRVMSAQKAQWAPMLDDFVAAFAGSVRANAAARASLEEVEPLLMPRVGLPFEVEVEGEAPPARELVAGLLEVHLVVDEPGTVRTVRERDLDEWSIGFDDLYEVALANLERTTRPDRLVPLEGQGNTLVYDSGDSYDAARILLLPRLLDPWPREGVVVIVPSRDILLCVPLRGGEALAAMNTAFPLGHGLHEKVGYGISDQPFWFDGEVWEHVPVAFGPAGLEIFPPDRFLRAIERLTTTRALLE
ncbi:MAG: hypothetical protein HYY06_17480 [Deltaproteobacteria bacterium]|nr:hypothetical protein [Deltaproteobacteria bacterium]